jgi:hypothetical protein
VRRARVWLLCCSFAWGACASAPSATPNHGQGAGRPSVPPPALLLPSALLYDFQWRQRVTARWPTGTHSFDAVLQKREGELILVGLSPLGLPGFVLRLNESGALNVENRTDQALPFEPAYVVADVQRVFFPWLAAPAPDFSGERTGEHAGTQVFERFAHGQLQERRLTRETPSGSERVVILYPSPSPQGAAPTPGDAPAKAELKNELLGYELQIVTLEQSRL